MERKKALVTGAATGIGKGIAIELIKAGYDVAVHCHSSAPDEVIKIGEQYGAKVMVIRADISSPSDIERMFREYKESFKTLDLFVNNAGLTITAPFLELKPEDFDKMCDVDFKGAYFCMQNAAKLMIENGTHGSMVVISSNNSFTHFARASAYGSIKAGVTKLAEHAALELSKYKIRVNTIAPGWTDTGAARLDDKESTYYKIPLKRWCTPEEIGKAVLYFASDFCDSVSGATLVIDGAAQHLSDKGERYGF